MRICLLGDFTGNPDEGMKNTSLHIRAHLFKTKHEILCFHPRKVMLPGSIKNLRNFNPEIIHYLHGPTMRSLIILKLIKLCAGNKAETVITAMRPYFSLWSSWAVYLFKAHVIIVQANRAEEFFKSRGFRTIFVPNGVDCSKFYPAAAEERFKIRQQYNLPQDKKIILHVGHIKKNRNLNLLKDIQDYADVQVLAVGSTHEKTDKKLKSDLQRSGVKVYEGFFPDIEKFYKMADLYVFPVVDDVNNQFIRYNQIGAIDLPLSVMEAMACNLPVITTRFGALPRIFEADEGLTFCNSKAEIVDAVNQIKGECNTRNKVLPYDWENIIKDIKKIYEKLSNNI